MTTLLALVLALQAAPARPDAPPADRRSSLKLEIASSDESNEQPLRIELTPWGVSGPGVALKKTLPRAPRSEVFRIEDLAPGSYRLVLFGPALAREQHRVEVPAKGIASLDLIRLAPGVSLAGRISDPSGGPLPRVSVHFMGSEGSLAGATDADGTFVVEGLKRGASYHYVIRDESHFQVEGEWKGEPRLDRTMAEATLLSGRVVDANGGPVADAKLGFGSVSKTSSGAGGSPYKTDADGRFLARAPNRGTNRLLLNAVGFLPLEREISLEKDGVVAPEIDLGAIGLERGRHVRGRVVEGSTGLPVAGARLTYQEIRDLRRDFRLRLDQERVTSSEDGTFEFRAVPGDTEVSLLAERDGFARRLVTLARDEAAAVEVTMTPGGRIEAVLCGSSAEIARSVLDLEFPGMSAPSLNRPPDLGGRAVFENVAPGRVVVRRSWRSGDGGFMTNGSDARTEVEVAEGATSRAQVACGPVPVAGVVFVDGRPAAGMLVGVTTGRIHRGVWALTDAAGRFQVRVETPGAYAAAADGFRLVSRESCAVPEGGRSDCAFELRAPAPR